MIFPGPSHWARWLQARRMQWQDRYTRWKEVRHLRHSEGIPSPEAVDEATEYYLGLYTEKEPDAAAFKRLLSRRGVPDWTNPYDISDERYHRLHPEGFLWADASFLAQELLDRAGRTVEENAALASRLNQAQVCWMLMLEHNRGQYPRTLRDIHPDNLAAITMEAFLNPSLSLWGVDPSRWTHLPV